MGRTRGDFWSSSGEASILNLSVARKVRRRTKSSSTRRASRCHYPFSSRRGVPRGRIGLGLACRPVGCMTGRVGHGLQNVLTEGWRGRLHGGNSIRGIEPTTACRVGGLGASRLGRSENTWTKPYKKAKQRKAHKSHDRATLSTDEEQGNVPTSGQTYLDALEAV